MAELNFDLDEVEAEAPMEGGFESVQEGWYRALVTGCVPHTNGDSKGGLKVEYSLIDTPRTRRVFDYIVTRNPSEVATRIGKQTLKKLAMAQGISSGVVRTTEALMENPFWAFVKLSKANEGYGDSLGMENRVAAFKTIDDKPTKDIVEMEGFGAPAPVSGVSEPPPAPTGDPFDF